MRKTRIQYSDFDWQLLFDEAVKIIKEKPNISSKQLLIFSMGRVFPIEKHLGNGGINNRHQEFYDEVIKRSKVTKAVIEIPKTLGQQLDEKLNNYDELKAMISYNKAILLNILDRLGIKNEEIIKKQLLKIAVVGLLGEQASMLAQQCKDICNLTPYTNVKESTVKGFINYDYVIITRHANHPVFEKAKIELGSSRVFRLDTTNISAIIGKINELVNKDN